MKPLVILPIVFVGGSLAWLIGGRISAFIARTIACAPVII